MMPVQPTPPYDTYRTLQHCLCDSRHSSDKKACDRAKIVSPERMPSLYPLDVVYPTRGPKAHPPLFRGERRAGSPFVGQPTVAYGGAVNDLTSLDTATSKCSPYRIKNAAARRLILARHGRYLSCIFFFATPHHTLLRLRCSTYTTTRQVCFTRVSVRGIVDAPAATSYSHLCAVLHFFIAAKYHPALRSTQSSN